MLEKKRERERERETHRHKVTWMQHFFTSVSSTAGSPCESAGCDGAISRSRKTEVDFRRWGRQTGVAVAEVAGPIDSPPWRRGPRSARGPGPGPDRPRNPRFPPTRPRTCRCYRDTLFWRCCVCMFRFSSLDSTTPSIVSINKTYHAHTHT